MKKTILLFVLSLATIGVCLSQISYTTNDNEEEIASIESAISASIDIKYLVEEDASCLTSCLDMANAIWDTYVFDGSGPCSEVCFTLPSGFSPCFTGYIEWGDGNTTSLNSISLCHIYNTSPGLVNLKVIVEKKGTRCKVTQYIQVDSCN